MAAVLQEVINLPASGFFELLLVLLTFEKSELMLELKLKFSKGDPSVKFYYLL